MTQKTAHNWEHDELSYCEHLIHNRGDEHVPQRYVTAYLRTQIKLARMVGRGDVMNELLKLLTTWIDYEGEVNEN